MYAPKVALNDKRQGEGGTLTFVDHYYTYFEIFVKDFFIGFLTPSPGQYWLIFNGYLGLYARNSLKMVKTPLILGKSHLKLTFFWMNVTV